jgi:small redox-active disulfide protein 2
MGRGRRDVWSVLQTVITYSFRMEIKILGTGCARCKTLEKLTRDTVSKNSIDATITKVDDIMEIMKFNIMTTPALVIDGKVVLKGRIPSAEEMKQLLTQNINNL